MFFQGRRSLPGSPCSKIHSHWVDDLATNLTKRFQLPSALCEALTGGFKKWGAVLAAKEELLDRIWTVPNIISYARVVLLLPAVLGSIASEEYWLSLVAAATLGATDWLDGFLARRLGQRSQLGVELDPVADRVSIVLILVVMASVHLLPWAVLVVIAAVDLFLFVLALVWFKGYPNTKVTWVGKVRTAFLLTGIPLLLLAAAMGSEMLRSAALVLVGVGVVGHVVAGMQYFEQMFRGRKQTAKA